MNGLQRTLTATLKMLAYGNGWFSDDGTLILPAPVPTTEEHDRIASANVYLASICARSSGATGDAGTSAAPSPARRYRFRRATALYGSAIP